MPKPNFFELVRMFLESGQDYRFMAFTKQQKERLRVCLDLYDHLRADPYFNERAYLKNKYGRTDKEIRYDMETVNFMMSILNASTKEISRYRVKRNAEIAMKMAHDQGDPKAMIAAGDRLERIERLNEPDSAEDLENSVPKLPEVLPTRDPRNILPGKTYSDSAVMAKIRAKWGVKMDPHQEMVEQRVQQLLASDGEDVYAEEEPQEDEDEE